jgi:hypothetical protein
MHACIYTCVLMHACSARTHTNLLAGLVHLHDAAPLDGSLLQRLIQRDQALRGTIRYSTVSSSTLEARTAEAHTHTYTHTHNTHTLSAQQGTTEARSPATLCRYACGLSEYRKAITWGVSRGWALCVCVFACLCFGTGAAVIEPMAGDYNPDRIMDAY